MIQKEDVIEYLLDYFYDMDWAQEMFGDFLDAWRIKKIQEFKKTDEYKKEKALAEKEAKDGFYYRLEGLEDYPGSVVNKEAMTFASEKIFDEMIKDLRDDVIKKIADTNLDAYADAESCRRFEESERSRSP